MTAEGRPSSLQEEDQGIQRRRRSPNLGIATLALDALGKAFGVGALGSKMSPAEAALAVFVTRKIINNSSPIHQVQVVYVLFKYPQTRFTNN